jgi:p-hydroxybenzoate 3-monooxygenase
VVAESRSRAAIEAAICAGVLEHGTVDLMTEIGVGARMKSEGFVRHGIELRLVSRKHRVDLHEFSGGRAMAVYAQHEVLKELMRLHLNPGGDILFDVSDVRILDVETKAPRITFAIAGDRAKEFVSDFLGGCDGSHSVCRTAIPDRKYVFRIYPARWFGILAKAPPSCDELICAYHDRGLALVSTRSPDVQRMCSQCGPMQYGRPFLAGDAAHSVPPTVANGLNLAEVHLLARTNGA